MFTSNLLALLFLGPLTLVSAQMDGKSYCNIGDQIPDKNACLAIKEKGVRDNEHYTTAEWMNGNCRVRVGGLVSGTILGKDLKNTIQDILDKCDVGFQYKTRARVEVELCTLEYGGGKTVCRGGLQQVGGSWRRHLTDVQSTPKAPITPRFDIYRNVINQLNNKFVECGGGPGSATIGNCIGIVEEMMEENPDQTVSLPFKADDGGDCQVEVWPTSRDRKQVNTGLIKERIEATTSKCADPTGEIIGFAADYSPDTSDYHIFVGQFCGRLGAATSGRCFPGGK